MVKVPTGPVSRTICFCTNILIVVGVGPSYFCVLTMSTKKPSVNGLFIFIWCIYVTLYSICLYFFVKLLHLRLMAFSAYFFLFFVLKWVLATWNKSLKFWVLPTHKKVYLCYFFFIDIFSELRVYLIETIYYANY